MPLIMRWAHIGATVVAVGGLALLVGTILPALRAADPEQAVLLLRDVLRRARAGLWVCAAALVASGFYAASLVRDSATPNYHSLLGIKVLLGLGFLVAAFVGTRLPPEEAGFSRRRIDWLWLSLALGAAAVLLSSYLRELRAP